MTGASKGFCTAAAHLEKSGLARVTRHEYVKCADPEDRDFPPKNRNCPGRIYLRDGFDESGYDYRCPDCERPVFPGSYKKRRHTELRVRVLPAGITDYVSEKLKGLGNGMKQLCDGLFRVEAGDMGVVVCIVDCCEDEKYTTRDWASNYPTCYIVVNQKAMEERFLDEAWLTRLCLADLVCGKADLAQIIQELAESAPPAALSNVSMPVYAKGVKPVRVQPVEPVRTDRLFVVQVGSKTVCVDGVNVVAPQSSTGFLIFRILWERFIDDLKSGLELGEFRALNVKALGAELGQRTGEYIEELMNVRKSVNRLQAGIETAVKKKLGEPIDREDIIQTCKWQGTGDDAHGYRINPFTVAARPFQADVRGT